MATHVAQTIRYNKVRKLLDLDITKGVRRTTEHILRISESVPTDERVVIYDASNAGNNVVWIFNVNTGKVTPTECNRNIWQMVTLSADRHVIIEDDNWNVHLIDDKFNTVDTLRYEKGESCDASSLCLTAQHTVLLAEEGQMGSKFSEIKVENNSKLSMTQLCESEEEIMGAMTMCSDGRSGQVILARDQYKSLVKIDMHNAKVIQYIDMEEDIIDEIHNITCDEQNNILVADRGIAVFNADTGEFRGIRLRADDKEGLDMTVYGVCVRKDKVIGVTHDGRLLVYGEIDDDTD